MEATGGVSHCHPHSTLSSGEFLWIEDPRQIRRCEWHENSHFGELSLNPQVIRFS